MLQARYGEEYEIIGSNDPTQLARLSPTGDVRCGAWEVVRVDTDEVLYSKKEQKRHLVGSRKRDAAGEMVHDDDAFVEWCETVLDVSPQVREIRRKRETLRQLTRPPRRS